MSKSKDLSIAAAIASRYSSQLPYPVHRVARVGLVVGLLLGTAPVFADPPVYNLIEIPNQPGSTSPVGTAINNNGDLTLQTSDAKGQSHAFLWKFSNRRLIALGTLGGTANAASDINDCGDVVGWSQLKGNTLTHAVLYREGKVIDLAPQGQNSSAEGINNQGAIVGSFAVNGVAHPASFEQGLVKDLTGQAGTAHRISLSGRIIGQDNATGNAFFLESGQATDIDDGGSANNFTIATGINDFGDVAIVEQNGPFVALPFVFEDGNLAALIDDVNGLNLGQPLAVNNSGELVGFVPSVGPSNSVVTTATYARGSTVNNLVDLLDPTDPLSSHVTLTNAFGINDSGWIGAVGTDSRDNSTHVFLLTRKSPAVRLERVLGSCHRP